MQAGVDLLDGIEVSVVDAELDTDLPPVGRMLGSNVMTEFL